ncbi:hypothetical protein BU14_0324s0006 [Porphyra umbilicalis]|uniref:Uncharacterized protein n=1 Tax=Porphyra umbilicalis TaxID=2786 RepID=A0A1X6NZ04_PORUM|nr:hypothetical protein BU14_0324s0006 [Porphyra umbilicalis]|eukprot:OSX73844.1 hypothetical protein BU14_0324s0006 [Porphyra umbilicalis]
MGLELHATFFAELVEVHRRLADVESTTARAGELLYKTMAQLDDAEAHDAAQAGRDKKVALAKAAVKLGLSLAPVIGGVLSVAVDAVVALMDSPPGAAELVRHLADPTNLAAARTVLRLARDAGARMTPAQLRRVTEVFAPFFSLEHMDSGGPCGCWRGTRRRRRGGRRAGRRGRGACRRRGGGGGDRRRRGGGAARQGARQVGKARRRHRRGGGRERLGGHGRATQAPPAPPRRDRRPRSADPVDGGAGRRHPRRPRVARGGHGGTAGIDGGRHRCVPGAPPAPTRRARPHQRTRGDTPPPPPPPDRPWGDDFFERALHWDAPRLAAAAAAYVGVGYGAAERAALADRLRAGAVAHGITGHAVLRGGGATDGLAAALLGDWADRVGVAVSVRAFCADVQRAAAAAAAAASPPPQGGGGGGGGGGGAPRRRGAGGRGKRAGAHGRAWERGTNKRSGALLMVDTDTAPRARGATALLCRGGWLGACPPPPPTAASPLPAPTYRRRGRRRNVQGPAAGAQRVLAARATGPPTAAGWPPRDAKASAADAAAPPSQTSPP